MTIELDKLLDWTLSTIHYYLYHRANENDKVDYLNKIIAYCKAERGKCESKTR